MELLSEWYDPDADPRDALTRKAQRLSGAGALYLGGGVGVEKQGNKDAPTFVVTADGKKSSSHPGALSAATAAYKAAGASSAVDSPGGASKITDASIAARVHELEGAERDAKRDIIRFEARIAARARRTGLPTSYASSPDGDDWEARRLEELRATVKSIATEKARLIAGKAVEGEEVAMREPGLIGELGHGEVSEVEQARPGTNFTKIPPQNVKRLSGIVQHYAKMTHGFTTCVRDQVKHGLSEDHAKRRCAVVKDLGKGTTKWRKGGKATEGETVAFEALALAESRLAVVDETLGEGAAARLALSGADGNLAEMCATDLGLLALAGDERAETIFEGKVLPRHRDGKWTNVLARVRDSGEQSPLKSADGSLRLHTEPAPVVRESVLDSMLRAEDERA